MKPAVQATSIHALHANAPQLSESREIVAREILELTKRGKPAWISKITAILREKHPGGKIEKSSISARFNDLYDLERFPEGFMLDGKRYRMVLLKNRVFDPESGKSGQFVQAWALALYQSPVGQGEQVKLQF